MSPAASAAPRPGPGAVGPPWSGPSSDRRLVLLLGARLALALVSLGIALGVDTTWGSVDEPGRVGLYGTVALAFLAIVVCGLVLPSVERPQRFAAANVVTDIVIVSGLVHFSGGSESVFAFLYVLVTLYGALLFGKGGALVTGGLGALAYAAVLGVQWGLAEPGAGWELRDAVAAWTIQAGAIAAVAALAGALVSELQRTGEALRQRTTDLRALTNLYQRTVDSLMSGLLTTDPEGRVTSFNPEAERITGWSAGEALGRGARDLLPGLELLEGGDVEPVRRRGRIPYRNRGGQGLHLGVGTYVLRDGEGKPAGHVVIFQDVTEVVEMEAELRRSERLAAVGELSASIAHEIRNPLASISGSIQVLRRRGPPGAAGEDSRLMDIVVREAERLNGLITDFLLYARPGPLEIERVGLRELADDLLEMASSSFDPKIRVALDLPPGLEVCADPGQLRQMLWNLVLNACQAMPGGGSLVVSAREAPGGPPQERQAGGRNTEEEGGWVEIAVRDHGTGIDPGVAERVFEPFYTTKPGGTGLGLATVHRIVEEHSGVIRLESQPGVGTTVRVWLPRVEEDS